MALSKDEEIHRKIRNQKENIIESTIEEYLKITNQSISDGFYYSFSKDRNNFILDSNNGEKSNIETKYNNTYKKRKQNPVNNDSNNNNNTNQNLAN